MITLCSCLCLHVSAVLSFGLSSPVWPAVLARAPITPTITLTSLHHHPHHLSPSPFKLSPRRQAVMLPLLTAQDEPGEMAIVDNPHTYQEGPIGYMNGDSNEICPRCNRDEHIIQMNVLSQDSRLGGKIDEKDESGDAAGGWRHQSDGNSDQIDGRWRVTGSAVSSALHDLKQVETQILAGQGQHQWSTHNKIANIHRQT